MSDCIFCAIASGESPCWKVHETDSAVAFLDINPVAEYHTLVVPRRHSADMFEVTKEDLRGLMSAVKDVVDLYRTRLGISNLQVISNAGREAQQDVFHLHVHIVPRRKGDGLDVRWKPRPELRARFEAMVTALM